MLTELLFHWPRSLAPPQVFYLKAPRLHTNPAPSNTTFRPILLDLCNSSGARLVLGSTMRTLLVVFDSNEVVMMLTLAMYTINEYGLPRAPRFFCKLLDSQTLT